MAGPEGEFPDIEVVTDANHSRTDVAVESSPNRPRSPWIVVVVAAIVVMVAAGLIAGGDPGPQDTTSTSSTTTLSGRTTLTSAPGPQAGAYLTGEFGPLLGEPVNASLLVENATSGWRHINLDTGWVDDVPPLNSVPSDEVHPIRGGVVIEIETQWPIIALLPPPEPGLITDPAFDRVSVEVDEPMQVIKVMEAGDLDSLWLLTSPWRPDAEDDLIALNIDLDGRLLKSVPLPTAPTSSSSFGPLFNAGGHSYLLTGDGTRDLGAGAVFTASGPYAGRVVCDASARCSQEILDLRTGDATRGVTVPTDAAASGQLMMSQASDGTIASLVTGASDRDSGDEGESGSTPLYITHPDGRSVMYGVDYPRSAPMWLPDDAGLLILTAFGLMHYYEDGGVQLTKAVRAISAQDVDSIVLVRHDTAPPAP